MLPGRVIRKASTCRLA